MHIVKDLENIMVVNEGVLIVPIDKQDEKVNNLNISFSKANEQNHVLIGWVVKYGPGYHIGAPKDSDDAWKEKVKDKSSDYIQINVAEGDKVYYHRNNVIKIVIGSTEYNLVKFHDILLIDRISS